MEKSLFKDILEKSKKSKEILSIYFYGDSDDDFWAGYIEDYNESFVSIRHFTKYGVPDGLIVKDISSLKRIDSEDEYAKSIQYLVKHSEELHKESTFKLPLTQNENWQFEVLKKVVGTTHMVRLEINDEYPCGFVTKLTDTEFLLHWIGERGEDYGKSVFKVEDISLIRVNDIELRKRKLLYQWKYKDENETGFNLFKKIFS